MSGQEYPSVGLAVDLTQIVELNAGLDSSARAFKDLGTVAVAESAKVTGAVNAMAAGSSGVVAARKAEGDAAAASGAQETKAIADSLKAAQASFKLRMRFAREAYDDEAAQETASVKAAITQNSQLLALRMRLNKQQAAEAATTAKQIVADQEVANRALVADDEQTQLTILAFRTDRLDAERRLIQANLEANSRALAQQVAEEEQAQSLIEQFMADRVMYDARMRAQLAAQAKEEADAEIAAAEKQALAQTKVMDAIKTQSVTMGMSKAELAAYRAEQAGVTAEAAPFVARIAQAEQALSKTGTSAAKVREPLVVIREFFRGDFSRMAGSLSIIAQQFGLMGFLLNPVVLGIIALVGAITAFVFAMEQGSEEQAHLQNSLRLTGQYAGQTADQIQMSAKRSADATDSSVGKSIAAYGVLVASGRVTGDTFNNMGDAAVRLGELTHTSATKIAEDFVRMAGDPVRAMNTLNEQYHFLNAAQYDHIKALVEEGDKTTAMSVLFAAFDKDLASQTSNFGFLERAIRSTGKALSDFWQGIKDFGKQAPAVQQVADLTAHITTLQAQIDNPSIGPGTGFRANQGRFQAPAMQAQLKDLVAQRQGILDKMHADEAKAAKAAEDQRLIDSSNAMESELSGVKENHAKALREMADYRANAKRILAAPAGSVSQDAIDNASWAMGHQALMDARINQKYAGGKMPGAHTPSTAAADNAVTKLTAEIGALQQQIDEVSADPLADMATKIQKAADTAAAAYSHGKNTAYADTVRSLAAEKEELTIRLQMLEVLVKETRAAQDQADALAIETKGRQAATAAMDSYYQSGSTTSTDLQAALQKVAEAQRAATNGAIELAIAQKYGVTSIDDIAQAYLSHLPAAEQNTQAAKDAAAQMQAQAKATAAAQEATAALTDEEKKRGAQDTLHTQNLQAISDLEAYTKALLAGRDALIAYNIQKTANAQILAAPLPADATPAQRLAQASTAQKDATDKRISDLVNQEALITEQMKEQDRLASKTSAERAAADQINLISERMILQAKQQGQVLTMADVQDAATQLALTQQWQKKITDLKTQIQDTMRDTFIKTGKLDFSSLKQGVEEALRQAVYDQLLAKPISIVVNAVMNIATQGVQSILNSLLGTGGSGSGVGSFLSSIFGKSGGLTKLLGGPATSLGQAAGSLSTASAGLSSILGPAAAVAFLGGSIGSQIGKALGNQKGGTIGGALFGVVGSIIGGLLGDHSGHATAAVFNNQGQYVSNALSPKGSTTATINAAGEIGNATQTLIAQFKAMGINADAVIGSIEQGTRNDARLFLQNGKEISSPNGDTQALSDNITRALYQYGIYTNAQESEVVHQLLSMNATLDQINTAVQAFNQAQTDFKTVTEGLLKYTDPKEYAIQTTIDAQIQRRQTLQADITAGYFSQDQINQLAQTLPQLEQNELQDALNNLASSATGAAHSLADMITAQQAIITYVDGLKTGPLSNLSPEAILNQDAQNFFASLTKAKTGDYDSLNGITTVADAYLQQAQAFYGSTDAYNAIFSTVTDALSILGTQTLTSDPQTAAITQGMQELKDAINAAGVNIVGAINDNAQAGTGAPVTGTFDLTALGGALGNVQALAGGFL